MRVSTAGQVEQFGPEAQRDAITSWAKANGYRIVDWYEDLGVSGTKEALDRSGASMLLDRLGKGDVDGVVALTLSRFARQLHVQEAFLGLVWRSGARVFTVDGGEVPQDDPTDPTRTLIRQVLGAVAQYDRASIVNQMLRGKRIKEAQGRYIGGRPAFGQRAAGKELVEDDAEMAVVARVVALRRQGLSYREIVAELNAAGVRPKAGEQWHATQVRRVCERAVDLAR